MFNTMQYLTELLNLVEAAASGDRKKGAAYARLLAEKLQTAGETKAAERILRALTTTSKASAVTAAGGAAVLERLPVDSESRLSLADESLVRPEEVEIFLDSPAAAQVEEFIRYVQASDRLVEEGVGVAPSLLMYGPPGCGKTELAKYISAQLHLPLLTARIDSLVSSFLGSTAKNLRMLFEHAAARPCVLFLDEFDAIAKLRDDRQELGELKRVVVSLLQNIDAIYGETVLLAATNHEHLLDPAIWRRFTYRIHIELPGLEARRKMFSRFLASPVETRSLERFALASEGLSGSDIRQICEGARRASVIDRLDHIPESDVLRRILLRILNGDGLTTPELIAQAKQRCPDVFTHRVLASMLGMSPGNITHILKKRSEA